MTNLSHNASFHSNERIAPSNRGIKHLISPRTFLFAGALTLALAHGLASLSALAQESVAPVTFTPVAVPADWDSLRLEGITVRLPPGIQTVHESEDEKLWALADMATRTGIAFGISYDDAPERDLRRGKTRPEDSGLVVFPDGHLFRRWRTVMPKTAGVSGEVELLISERPVRGEDRVILMLMATNTRFEDHRATFDSFVSGVALPPPGTPMARDVLDGLLRLPLDQTWMKMRSRGPDRVEMGMQDMPGELNISRGTIDTGPMPAGTVGRAVTFMGEPAQLFAYKDKTVTHDDGTGQAVQARIVILESCLPDGRPISLRFLGMPAFYHADALHRAFAEGSVEMPDGSRPCPPGTLPQSTQILPAGQSRPVALPPFGAPEKGPVLPRLQGSALDGLFVYDMAPGWTEAPGGTADLLTLHGPEGERIVMARGEMAIAGPGGLASVVPAGTFPNSDVVLGWPVLGWLIHNQTTEFRVNLYEHCLADGTPFGIGFQLPKGIWNDRPGSKLRGMVDLVMPPGVILCPDSYQAALVKKAQASGAIQTAPDPAPAQSTPVQSEPTLSGKAQSAPAQSDTAKATQPAPLPAPASPQVAADDPDLFLPGEGGYALYRNARYGTHISYPASYFLPDPPPDSGDGRNFTSVDGWARFYVFAQYEAEGLSQAQRMARDIAAHGEASYRDSGDGWYVISGITGGDVYYRRVEEEAGGPLHVFEISYPPSRRQEFAPVVADMAQSFGPPQRE